MCNSVLNHNSQYSKNLTAAYNLTVGIYPNDHEKVYLNHCWGCEEIIDSRESKFKSPQNNKLYVCISCGSGDQKTSYKHGDICPSCEIKPMDKLDYRTYECSNSKCSHRIIVPNK